MIKFKGKEISQDEFDKIMTDAESIKNLADGYESKVKDLEIKVSDLDKLDAVQSELKTKSDELYKIKLDNRLQLVDTYLKSKDNAGDLIKKIGEMDEEYFKIFADGKTNDIYESNEQIKSAKTELENEKKELETNKDKIIKDALKQYSDENKTKDDQKLVPTGETGIENGTDDLTESGFPTLDKMKDIYGLKGNPMYDKNERMEENAKVYLDSYGDKPAVLH